MSNSGMVTVVGVVVSVVAGACASSPERTAGRSCELAAADSAYLAGGPVYRDCGVDQPARPASTRVDYTPGGGTPPRQETCYVAEVQFVVGPDGRPEQGTVRLVSTSDRGLADAVIASVPGWMYSPALRDGEAVRQIVRARRIVAVQMAAAGAGRPTGPPRGPNCR